MKIANWTGFDCPFTHVLGEIYTSVTVESDCLSPRQLSVLAVKQVSTVVVPTILVFNYPAVQIEK